MYFKYARFIKQNQTSRHRSHLLIKDESYLPKLNPHVRCQQEIMNEHRFPLMAPTLELDKLYLWKMTITSFYFPKNTIPLSFDIKYVALAAF